MKALGVSPAVCAIIILNVTSHYERSPPPLHNLSPFALVAIPPRGCHRVKPVRSVHSTIYCQVDEYHAPKLNVRTILHKPQSQCIPWVNCACRNLCIIGRYKPHRFTKNDIHCVEIVPFVSTGQSFMTGEANNLTKKGVDTQQDRERRAGGNFLREESLKQARE